MDSSTLVISDWPCARSGRNLQAYRICCPVRVTAYSGWSASVEQWRNDDLWGKQKELTQTVPLSLNPYEWYEGVCGDRPTSDHLWYNVVMNICTLIRRSNSVTLSPPCAGQEGVLRSGCVTAPVFKLKIRWKLAASHPSYPTPGKKSAWYRLNTGWFGPKTGLNFLGKKEVSHPWWYSKPGPSSSGVPRGGLGLQTPPPTGPKFRRPPQNRAKLNPIVKTVKNWWT